MVDHAGSVPDDLHRCPPPAKKVDKRKRTYIVSESQAKSNPNKDRLTTDDEALKDEDRLTTDDETLLDEDIRGVVSSDGCVPSKMVKEAMSYTGSASNKCKKLGQVVSMRDPLKTASKSLVINSSCDPVLSHDESVSLVWKTEKRKRSCPELHHKASASSPAQPFQKSNDDAPDPNIPDDSLDLWETDDSDDNDKDDDNGDEIDDVDRFESKMSALDRALNERLCEASSQAVGLRVDVCNKDLKNVLHSGENAVSPQNIIELKIEKFFSDKV